MSRLREAIDAAEDRKQSAFGDDAVGIAAGGFESRAIFSGFDIDHDELTAFASVAGQLFHNVGLNGELGQRPLLSAAWTEGFLIGLMFGQLPSEGPGGAEDG